MLFTDNAANPALSVLSVEDILNFRSTCAAYRNLVTHSNFIWRKVYQRWWPDVLSLLPPYFDDWMAELDRVLRLHVCVGELLDSMLEKFHNHVVLTDADLDEWSSLAYGPDEDHHPRKAQYIISYLLNIYNNEAPIHSIVVVPISTPGNLTRRFYAYEVIAFLRRQPLALEWAQFVDSTEEEHHIMERGAALIAQWLQPELSLPWTKIRARLDGLTNEVRQHLRITAPMHPLFAVEPDILAIWRDRSIDGKSAWCHDDCLQILHAINYVLGTVHSMSVNNDIYYLADNSFINRVLDTKKGLPIVLAIIVEGIARRMGVDLIPIDTTSYFHLGYIDHDTQVAYRVCLNKIKRRDRILGIHKPLITRVMSRMIRNLWLVFDSQINGSEKGYCQCSWLIQLYKLALIVRVPDDITRYTQIGCQEHHYFRSINHQILSQVSSSPIDCVRLISRVMNEFYDETYKIKVNRNKKMLYAVGMVLYSQKQRCRCVILDWDTSTPQIYLVITEKNLILEVEQHDLSITTDFTNLKLPMRIGKHFSHYFRTHYVPNAEKEKEYPQDKEIRHKFHLSVGFGNDNLLASSSRLI